MRGTRCRLCQACRRPHPLTSSARCSFAPPGSSKVRRDSSLPNFPSVVVSMQHGWQGESKKMAEAEGGEEACTLNSAYHDHFTLDLAYLQCMPRWSNMTGFHRLRLRFTRKDDTSCHYSHQPHLRYNARTDLSRVHGASLVINGCKSPCVVLLKLYRGGTVFACP